MTDLADAIREKTGTTEPINPQDFSDTIKGIQSGGGAMKNDVTFRDYDGTILHSYSKDDFLALTEMPELPTREGLICQGWNRELDTAKSQVTEYDKCDIGATYITDDGKTRLYIHIADKNRQNVCLYISQSENNGVTIDWGDGSEKEVVSTMNSAYPQHNYAKIGDYCITLDVAESCIITLNSTILYSANYPDLYANMLQSCEIGARAKLSGAFSGCGKLSSVVIPKGSITHIGRNAFQNCYSLASVVIPKGVTKINEKAFSGCYSLASVVIPQEVTSIDKNAFQNCYTLASVVIPKGVTSIGNYAFDKCYSLASVVIPKGVTSIGDYAFQYGYTCASVVIPEGVASIGSAAFSYCTITSIVIPGSVTSIKGFSYCSRLASIVILQGVTSIGSSAFSNSRSLSSVAIPQSVTSIGSQAFYNCSSLSSVAIPQSVTSIGSQAFSGCSALAMLDFRTHTSVPALSNTNAFSSVASDLKIVVPDALYDDWIASTNWSDTSVSKYIVKDSEFNG